MTIYTSPLAAAQHYAEQLQLQTRILAHEPMLTGAVKVYLGDKNSDETILVCNVVPAPHVRWRVDHTMYLD